MATPQNVSIKYSGPLRWLHTRAHTRSIPQWFNNKCATRKTKCLWVPYRFRRFHAKSITDAHSNTYLTETQRERWIGETLGHLHFVKPPASPRNRFTVVKFGRGTTSNWSSCDTARLSDTGRFNSTDSLMDSRSGLSRGLSPWFRKLNLGFELSLEVRRKAADEEMRMRQEIGWILGIKWPNMWLRSVRVLHKHT